MYSKLYEIEGFLKTTDEGKISQMFYDLKIGNGATIKEYLNSQGVKKDIKIYNSEATYI